MRHLLAFVLLLLLALPAAAQVGVPPFTEDFPPEEFAERRARVFEAMGPNTFAVLQGAPSPRGYTRFRQTNEFYYLTGIEVPGAYLLLDGTTRRANLYLPHRNAGRERGEGKLLSAEDDGFIRDTLLFAGAYGVDLLAEHLARLARARAPRFPPSTHP